LNGTREGLFQIALYAVARKQAQINDDDITPVICLPNPLYHVYYGGVVMTGAEGYLLDATPDNGFVPDYDNIPEDVLERTAIIFLCNPGNPTGAVANYARLESMIKLARKYDFIIAFDECYSEIYFDTPPLGGLEVCASLDQGLDLSDQRACANVLVFNSLSKRSSAPGLRCGFVAGDADLIREYTMLRGYGGALVAGPLLAGATALWCDEAHVEKNRALYQSLFAVTDKYLGHLSGYHRPDAAFFIWLDVRSYGLDGEAITKLLWQQVGVKVMPGRYMSRPSQGQNGDILEMKTPGDHFIRIALVHAPKDVEDCCKRICQVLDQIS
jgi:aspartate/methionine/tyrosine aminotransferase